MQQKPGRNMLAPHDAESPTGLHGAQRDMASPQGIRDPQAPPAAAISHELRTSLAVVTLLSGNLDLLYERLDDAKRRKMIRDLRSQTQRLNDLIGDVLELCNANRPVSV